MSNLRPQFDAASPKTRALATAANRFELRFAVTIFQLPVLGNFLFAHYFACFLMRSGFQHGKYSK